MFSPLEIIAAQIAQDTSEKDLAKDLAAAFEAGGQMLATTAERIFSVHKHLENAAITSEQKAAFQEFAAVAIVSFRRLVVMNSSLNERLSKVL